MSVADTTREKALAPDAGKGRHGRLAGWPLALPIAVFLLIMFVSPFVIVVVSAFSGDEGVAANFARAFGSVVFWQAVKNTVISALLTVLITGAVALPFGYGLIMHARGRNVMLALLFAPLVINGIVRIYGMEAGLGLINTVLTKLGIIHDALPLNDSMPSIVIGFSGFMFPLMAVATYSSLARLDHSLIHAARTLGANRWRVLLHVVLPSAVPGLASGAILVFAASAGSYILPAMMGGGKVITLPQLVYDSISTNVGWNYSAALSLVLVALVVPFLLIASLRQRGEAGGR